MNLSFLPLPLLAVSVLAVPEVRADFNPSIVSSDARWVAYADLNALRQNPVGKEVIDAVQKQGSHVLPLPGASLTIDVPKLLATIGTITAYGAHFEKNAKQVDGTLVVAGTPDLRKIVEAVLLELEVGDDSVVHDLKGLGYSAYALEAKDKAHPENSHQVIVAFPPDGMVIVSQSEDKVRRAYELIQGKGASLAQATGSDLAGLSGNAAHAIIFAASAIPPDAVAALARSQPGPHTRILEMTHSASLALGDEGGKTFAHAQLVAADGDSADKLIKILQGMTAMLSLAQSNDQKLTEFINSAQATRDGDRVSFQLAYDSGQLADMVQGILATAIPAAHTGVTFTMHGPSANVEKILGKHVAGWKAEAAAQGEAGSAEPIWRDVAGVKLTNGAQITVHVAGGEGSAGAHFEAVQVKPAEEGGAALTFSRRMMTEARRPIIPSTGRSSRLLQFSFPGEDGTYTLRVRYTRPSEGSLNFDVWVKNDSGADNRASSAPNLEGMDAALEAASPDEAGLVRLVLDGDTGAFDGLVRAHSARVFRFLHHFVRNRHDAEDLTQQTFLRAYSKLSSFDLSRPMINWLLTIARRCALNHFRAAKPWQSLSESESFVADEAAVAPDCEAETNDLTGRLWERARERLSQREYEALWLRFGEDLSVKETARVMGITQPHVKILVFRAKRALIKGVMKS